MNLHIWDTSFDLTHAKQQRVIFWNRKHDKSSLSAISILEILEKDAGAVREEYLRFVHEIGQTEISSGRVIDQFTLTDDFSYWWMSLISEKSNFAKSRGTIDILKIIALERWLHDREVQHLKITSSNLPLIEVFSVWSKQRGINFEAQNINSSWVVTGRAISNFMQLPKVILWFFYWLKKNWVFKGEGVKRWQNSKGNKTFVSYFDNQKIDDCNPSIFYSDYWTKLPETLSKEGQITNWLHIYVRSEIIKTPRDGVLHIRKLNENKMQSHVMLSSFICFSVLRKALINWFKFSMRSKSCLIELKNNNDRLSLFWPLMSNDWRNFFQGNEGLDCLLKYHLFQFAFSRLPRQKSCVYLQENQGWENGLLAAWREFKNSYIIGFPHSAVRFWDLRRFFYPKEFLLKKFPLPMPDYIACSGPLIKSALIEGGYSTDLIKDVEALRFLYLGKQNKKRSHARIGKPPVLLVVGDYFDNNTDTQLNLLARALSLIGKYFTVWYKAHPNSNLDINKFNVPGCVRQKGNLSDLFDEVDLVYCSQHTSAALDAYCYGKAVICSLDSYQVNTSPLRGLRGAKFVSNADDLALILCDINKLTTSGRDRDLLTINTDLTLWKKLLAC